MMLYNVRPGDSPASIARTYGVSFDALIRANPHKPTTIVDGQTTWREILQNEEIVVPVGGMVGDAATDAMNALIAAGGPCLKANVGLVCELQKVMGVTADGKWGSATAAAASTLFPGMRTPGGCSPTPSWWVKGVSACPSSGGQPVVTTTPSSSLKTIANAALAALRADPVYCASVKKVGTPVNTAIHNFKKAWNAANPSNPVPIGTGNYEPIVQIAIALALDTLQDNVPPGCGAAPVVTPPAPPAPPQIQTTVAPPPTGFLDPCDPANVADVCDFQRKAGLTADGKYGTATAAAARKLDPNAPGPCSPRPSWWKPAGQSNCPGAAPPPVAPPTPPPIAPPPPMPTVTVTVPGEVQALVGIDPCSQSNVEIVRAAQRVLGLTQDGKYGINTAGAARSLLSSAPAACSPAPLWWGEKGTVAPPGPPPPPPPPPVVVTPPPPPVVVTPPPPPVAPPPPPVTPPGPGVVIAPTEKKGLSTGAIVAGAIGAAALVGVVALAMTGKKGTRGARGKRGPRGRKTAKRKTTRRKKR